MRTKPADLPAFRDFSAFACLALWVAGFHGLFVPVQAQSAPPPVPAVGQPVERDIKPGETHVYSIRLEAGQYMRVEVEQKKTDLKLTLLDSSNAKLVEVDLYPNIPDSEVLCWIAERAGMFRLEIAHPDDHTPAGRYALTLAESGPATAQDADRVAAQGLLLEGVDLAKREKKEFLERALAKYESALALCRSLDDKRGQAKASMKIGAAHLNLNQTEKSLEYFDQALKCWQTLQNRCGQAEALINLGGVQKRFNQPRKALEYYDQALSLYAAADCESGQALALNYMSVVYSAIGERKKAIEYLEKAAPLWSRSGDLLGEMQTLNNLGVLVSLTGNPAKALERYERALAIAERLKFLNGQAETLKNLGKAHFDLGNVQAALDHYDRSLAVVETLKNEQQKALLFALKGLVHDRLGEMRQALDLYEQSLEIATSLKDEPLQASMLSNIGKIHIDLGNSAKALEFLERSRQIQSRGEVLPVLGDTFHNIGVARLALGEYAEAAENLGQALEIRKKINDRRKQASVLNALASARYHLGDRAKALELHAEALRLSEAVGDRYGTALTLNHLGSINLDAGQFETSREQLLKALAIRREIRNRQGQAETLYFLAKLDRREKRLDQAQEKIAEAVKLVEFLRTNAGAEQDRISYFAKVQKYFEFYIHLLMERHRLDPGAGHDRTALEVNERLRARSLLDLLAESGVDPRGGIDPQLFERERRLSRTISGKSTYLAQLATRGQADAERAEVEREIARLTDEHRVLMDQIRVANPQYAALKQPQPLTCAEIQASLLDAETTLVEFALGDERSYVWVVVSNSVAVAELPARSEIEAAARRVYESLTNGNQADRGAVKNGARKSTPSLAAFETDFQTAARDLSRMILEPVQDKLTTKRVVVVPDGALYFVPFAALPVPSGMKNERQTPSSHSQPSTLDPRPMIERSEIVVLPSASVLAVLRRQVEGRKPASKTLAVIADPVYGLEDPRVKRSLAGKPPVADAPLSEEQSAVAARRTRSPEDLGDEADFGRLPFSRREALDITTGLPPSEFRRALDFDADLSTATSPELGQYRIVHFAAHGVLNNRRPELSGLILSQVNVRGEAKNGFLRLDVYNLNLRADLVVLSACRTALGKEIRGEGLVGLTRGFMYAGAERVAASLWKIDDRATAELMKAFYRHMLTERRPPAEALRLAQLEMMRTPRFKSPYFWAGFVLQGEWKEIKN